MKGYIWSLLFYPAILSCYERLVPNTMGKLLLFLLFQRIAHFVPLNTMKLQTLCVLILSGGSVCSAPVVWGVTIWSAASSGTERRLFQTQSHGHLCNCAVLLAPNNICSPPAPILPTAPPPFYVEEFSLIKSGNKHHPLSLCLRTFWWLAGEFKD